MTSLYQLSTQFEDAFYALIDSDLPADAIDDTLEGIEGEIEEKGKNVAYFIGNLEADAKAIDEAIKQMRDRSSALKVKANTMRDYLKSNMERCGISSISCPYFEIKVKNCPESVQIDDESMIPAEYMREKVTKTPDKTAIKKAGGCAGVSIVRNTRLEIK